MVETSDHRKEGNSLQEEFISSHRGGSVANNPVQPREDGEAGTAEQEKILDTDTDKNACVRYDIQHLDKPLDSLDIGSAGDLAKKILMGDTKKSKNNEDIEEDTEQHVEDHLPPPDGGYGWFVVLGSFLAHVLIGGLDRSDGLFFLEFGSRYGKSAALTAWPGALTTMIRSAIGPLASAISEKYSIRACVLTGGMCLGLAHILTAFSSSFYLLYITHGVLQGICQGLIYCPSVVIVALYFEKRRGVATGLASSGVGMGTVVVVPLVQLLFDTYGFTGGFLVLSAVCMNGIVIGMLFRPLFLHYKFIGQKGLSPEKPSAPETVMLSELTDAGDTTSVRSIRLRSSSTLATSDNEANHQLVGRPRNPVVRSAPKQFTDIKPHHITISTAEDHKVMKREGCFKSSIKILFPKQTDNPCTKDSKKQKQKLFQFNLLKDLPFLSFCFSICLFTAAFKSAFTFIPALAASRGLSTSQAVVILSVTGFVDTGGRIISGLILDLPRLRKARLVIYCLVTFSVATLSALMPLLGYNFAWLCAVCSVYGLLSGLLVSQKSLIVVELLGTKNMASAFGLLLIFQGAGVGFGPLLSGAFKDAFGRFNEAFYLGAGLMGLSGCMMAFSAGMHRARQHREED